MLKNISEVMQKQGGKLIFCEGDSMLISSDYKMELPRKLLFMEDISFSVGVGTSTSLALLALKKAKGLGKKRIETFIKDFK
ncbi:hypothetical protein MHK_004862 [Candidatus Magnetomorum sp. HK-1]|nr:hypothetical protein MHK_004862 [Candidatus Magnetomorum sp. HK-1]